MSQQKRARAQAIAVDGKQRQGSSEKELQIIADANAEIHNPAIVGFVNQPRTSIFERPLWPSHDAAELHAPFYNPAIQDPRMTLALFVETKFIPEHVQFKTRAGQTHYQAILKHLITPETVSRIFNPEGNANGRLRALPHWPYLDAIRLCDLRPEHVRRVVSAADSAGYSAQTVKHIKNVCFAIVAHAQKEGCFSGPNPASLVKLPKIMRSSSPGVTVDQAKAILDLLQYPHREIALFALATGMSLPEICSLRWKDVNLDDVERFEDGRRFPARTLMVKTRWNRGGLGDSRVGGADRNIGIREPLLSTLRKLRTRTNSRDADDLVIVSGTVEKMLPASVRIGELKRVGKALGMTWLSWQDLRRTHQGPLGDSLFQLSASVPLSAGNTYTASMTVQASSHDEPVCESRTSNDSDLRRAFCFGRRFQAG